MLTFKDAVRRGVMRSADRDALVCDGERQTYAQFEERLERIHGLLKDVGTAAGDRIALISFNSIPFVELYFGVPLAGRVIVPLNFRWADAELAYALEDSGARVLICDRDPGELAALVDVVIRLDAINGPSEYDQRLKVTTPVPFVDADENDVVGLFYTGGTTGQSKGVILTHRNLITNAFAVQMVQPMDRDDTYLVVAPMFHAAGAVSLIQSVFLGATQVIVPAFDPGVVLDLIEAEGVTQTLGVPSMVAGIVEAQLVAPRDVSTLVGFSHGGSPIAMEVVRRGIEAFPGVSFIHVYGMTEGSPLVTGLIDETELLGTERAKSAGLPIMGIDVVIRDDSGNEVPLGEPGEVTIRGSNIMQGYWNKPEQTAQALRDGWYWSGDVGRMDDEGYLFLLDRSKDMIISGGENVYCTEVEDAIYAHPGVLEATVFGIPHEAWGEAVHAVVVLRDGAEATSAEIVEHCRTTIAGYKVPRSVEFSAEPLPKSGPGKVLKRQLRDPYWEGHETALG